MRVTLTPSGNNSQREVHRRRFSLEVGVRAQDHLGDALGVEPHEKRPHAQLFGADSVDRAQGSPENVVGAAELPGPLDGDNVSRILYDADDAAISTWIGADHAELVLCDVETSLAQPNAVLHLHDGLCEPEGALPVRFEHVKGDALSRARPYAG